MSATSNRPSRASGPETMNKGNRMSIASLKRLPLLRGQETGLIGVIIGSAVTWLTQGKHRRRARAGRQEAAQLLARAEAAEKRNAPSANVSGNLPVNS